MPDEVKHETIEHALAAAQREYPVLGKNATNPHFNSSYTDWTAVVEQIFPILHKHGITVRQTPTALVTADHYEHVLRTSLIHVESNTRVEDSIGLVGVGSPQQHGSAITYAKRYALLSMLGIATKDEDDDGNTASQPKQQRQRQQAQPAGAPKADGNGITEAQFKTLMKVEQERDFPEGFGQFCFDQIGVEKAIGELTKEEASAIIGAAMKRKKNS